MSELIVIDRSTAASVLSTDEAQDPEARARAITEIADRLEREIALDGKREVLIVERHYDAAPARSTTAKGSEVAPLLARVMIDAAQIREIGNGRR